jgi:hypothetical protein
MNYESFEKVRINKKAFIEWFYDIDSNQYRVTAKIYNREIYNKVLDKKHYEIYHNYINERISYLVDEEILNKEYDMILLDNTMYRVIDGTSHFMTLLRALIPVGGCDGWVLQDYLFDLVLDSTLRTGEVFDKYDLVFHNGVFYNQGKLICDINDFKRVGIDFEGYDLLNGLNEEQLEFVYTKIYEKLTYNFIQYYVTDKVKVKIR